MARTATRRRRPGARRAPARQPARRSTRRRSDVWSGARDAASRQLAGHRADAAAVALIVLGLLCTLGLVSDLAGSVGDGLASATGALLGRARVALPAVCFVLAVVLLSPRRAVPGGDDGGDAGERPVVRVAVGATA